MRLNNRVWLTILPVIASIYLLIFFSLYEYEKAAYLRHEQNRLDLHASELYSLYARYDNFTENYFSSLLQNSALHQLIRPNSTTLRGFGVERNLTNALSFNQDINFEKVYVSIIDSNIRPLYFYEYGGDPFAEIDPEMLKLSEQLFQEKVFHYKDLHFNANQIKIIRSKTVDRYTLREPTSDVLDNSVTIALCYNLTSLNTRLNELSTTQGYTFSWINSADNAAVNPPPPASDWERLQARVELTPNIQLAIQRPFSEVQKDLDKLLVKMAISALLLILLSSVLLIGLIEKYITNPIQKLEKTLLSASADDQKLPKPKDDNDEISSLNRAFYQLHKKLARSYEVSKQNAETDSLTNLYNRRKFRSCMEELVIKTRTAPVALLYMDIDNFKFVNDNFGHNTGDSVLKEFSHRLRSIIRSNDLTFHTGHDIARLAGDEFAIVLHKAPSEGGIIKVAERILGLFEHGFSCNEDIYPISISIGIAQYPRDGNTAEELVSNADIAMYQAKQNGKNQYQFYSAELAAKMQRSLQIETALKRKDFSEFSMFYMPVIQADSGAITGVEALIRWNNKELGNVSPAEFIPIVETKGLFEDFDLWVINRVLEDLPELHRALGKNTKISINISSAVLNSGTFFLQLMQLKLRHNLIEQNIILEITETFSTTLSKRVEANMNLLKQAGFMLALDDFGTGHTALVQLIDYPIDIIKIDKSLVDRMTSHKHDLVLALIGFCKKRGHYVTAEGVERLEQAEILRGAGVDHIQGFYFYKPMSLEDLQRLTENTETTDNTEGRSIV